MRIVYITTIGKTDHVISVPLSDNYPIYTAILDDLQERKKKYKLMLDDEATTAEENCEGCKADRLRV